MPPETNTIDITDLLADRITEVKRSDKVQWTNSTTDEKKVTVNPPNCLAHHNSFTLDNGATGPSPPATVNANASKREHPYTFSIGEGLAPRNGTIKVSG